MDEHSCKAISDVEDVRTVVGEPPYTLVWGWNPDAYALTEAEGFPLPETYPSVRETIFSPGTLIARLNELESGTWTMRGLSGDLVQVSRVVSGGVESSSGWYPLHGYVDIPCGDGWRD